MAVLNALHELSAAELSQRYASGALSPVDVARACLERIERGEPKLNAMYRVAREDAQSDLCRHAALLCVFTGPPRCGDTLPS